VNLVSNFILCSVILPFATLSIVLKELSSALLSILTVVEAKSDFAADWKPFTDLLEVVLADAPATK